MDNEGPVSCIDAIMRSLTVKSCDVYANYKATTPRHPTENVECDTGLHRLIEATKTRPLDESKLDAARKSLAQGEGETTEVEALAVIGAMDVFTKITQGTGTPAMPNFMVQMKCFVCGVIRVLYEFFFQYGLMSTPLLRQIIVYLW